MRVSPVVLTAVIALLPGLEARESAATWTARFTDVTAEAGIDFRHSFGDERISNIVEVSPGGCAFVDVDGDGLLDVYLLSGRWTEGVSDPAAREMPRHRDAVHRLYRNRGDGTFEDITKTAGVEGGAFGMGVVAADYDADGDQDLYLCDYGRNQLYRNDGTGVFTEVARDLGVASEAWSMGAAFLDYDNDGDLDLYVANYLVFDPSYKLHYAPDRLPGPLAYRGSADVLYRNDGAGGFTDVTKEAGLLNPQNRGMGLCIGDFDGDGRQDIFVSNDAMANSLFQNAGNGKFRDVGLEAGVSFGQNGDATAAMGAEFVDFDGDGRLDLYVPDDLYSCLYRNAGDGFFEDVTIRTGIAPVFGPFVGWGLGFGDFDLDGAPDLYVATGSMHRIEPMSQLIFGNRNGVFEDVSVDAGEFFDSKRMGRGVALGDYDNDGDLDILVLNLDDAPTLLRNDQPAGENHWLTLRLVGAGGNRDAIGAAVRVRHDGREQVRYVKSGGGYASHSDSRIHFGLGKSKSVERVEITWPTGGRSVLKDLDIDRAHVIGEPSREETRS